jgi:hypothetical protein
VQPYLFFFFASTGIADLRQAEEAIASARSDTVEPRGKVVFGIPHSVSNALALPLLRAVRQQLWAKRLSIPDGRGAFIEVSCVVAREVDAPPGVKPAEWRLLTNRELQTFSAATELIDWYRARWEIELFFHVLKNGCRVEALQLSSLERLERALALFMVVAWRIARLMRLGRTCPDLDVGGGTNMLSFGRFENADVIAAGLA